MFYYNPFEPTATPEQQPTTSFDLTGETQPPVNDNTSFELTKTPEQAPATTELTPEAAAAPAPSFF